MSNPGFPGQEGQWPPPGQQGQPQYGGQPQSGGYPQQGQPPQYPQHQHPQHPQHQHPQYAQNQYPQGGYGQQYPQGQYPQNQYPQGEYGGVQPSPGGTPPRKGRRGLIIGLVVALVALLGGGATWFAVSQSDSVASGAGTPTEAAQNLAGSLGNGDVVGLLSTLAPAEAALFTDPIADTTAELKRLQVLQQNADPKAISGIELKTENLTFDESQAQRVNDHLTITKLTGGTLTVNADLSKVPFAKDFLDAALPSSDRRKLERGPQTETINIGDEVRRNGQPIRIATVNVNGEWYPSVLYTIADYALLDQRQDWPQQSIPANGASSSNEAVQQLVQAALDADLRRVIELLPPDEMGVLHDAGPAILRASAGELTPSRAKLIRLETTSSPVNGGTRATLSALELQGPQGQNFTLTKSGDCYQMSTEGRSRQLCAGELADLIDQDSDIDVPAEAKQALRNLAVGVLKQGIGVITTEVDGKHYVSPIRSFVEQGLTVLRSLQPEDLKALLRIAN